MSVTEPGAPTPQDPSWQNQASTTPPDPAAPVTEAPTTTPDAPAASPPPAPDPAAPAAGSPTPAAPPAAPPAPPAPPSDSGDVGAQLEALRAKIDELEQKQQTQQTSLSATDAQLAEKVDELRSEFENWPQRGDQYADRPQPWDLQEHGLPQPGVTRDHLPGGQPDPLSPVVIAHSKPLLTAGMAGDAVAELASLLKQVGYSTSISEGRNHASAFDDTVTAAVNTFKRDYHVLEDPSQFRDPHEADRFVGPWIWEALIRAARLAEGA